MLPDRVSHQQKDTSHPSEIPSPVFLSEQQIKSQLVEDVQYPALLPFYLRSCVHEVLFQTFPVLTVCLLTTAHTCLSTILVDISPSKPLSQAVYSVPPDCCDRLCTVCTSWDCQVLETSFDNHHPDGHQIMLYSSAVHVFVLHLECIARFPLCIRCLNKYFNYQIP